MNTIFNDNPELNAYHETSDGKAFYTPNDAKNHAKTLTDKTVKLVERGNEPSDENAKPAKPAKAEELITAINAVTTVEALEPFAADTRKTVKEAYDAKFAELTGAPATTNDQNPAT